MHFLDFLVNESVDDSHRVVMGIPVLNCIVGILLTSVFNSIIYTIISFFFINLQ